MGQEAWEEFGIEVWVAKSHARAESIGGAPHVAAPSGRQDVVARLQAPMVLCIRSACSLTTRWNRIWSRRCGCVRTWLRDWIMWLRQLRHGSVATVRFSTIGCIANLLCEDVDTVEAAGEVHWVDDDEHISLGAQRLAKR